MYPRVNYEMTEEAESELLDACKPVPCMMIGSFSPPTPQGNVNMAWGKLGKKMGFDHMTVWPIYDKGARFFTAVPSETESQKEERLEVEAAETKLAEIKKLESGILELQGKLETLRA